MWARLKVNEIVIYVRIIGLSLAFKDLNTDVEGRIILLALLHWWKKITGRGSKNE